MFCDEPSDLNQSIVSVHVQETELNLLSNAMAVVVLPLMVQTKRDPKVSTDTLIFFPFCRSMSPPFIRMCYAKIYDPIMLQHKFQMCVCVSYVHFSSRTKLLA